MNGRIMYHLEPDDTNLFHKHSGLCNIKYGAFHQLPLIKFIWEFIPDSIYQGIDSKQYLMLPR